MEKEPINSKEMLVAQAEIWKFIFGCVDSMALKSAVELRIADIIHSHSQPITLSHIISSIGSTSPDITSLKRIMRFLVHRKIFTATPGSDGGEMLYGPTHCSRWLLRDAEFSLAPMLVMENDQVMLGPWHHLSDCVRDGGVLVFKKVHGLELWEYFSHNLGFSKMFNDGMACTARITLRAILEGYPNGFRSVGSVVDVGGGTGTAIAAIVEANPHIVGINFDQPHVIAMAREYPRVSHIGGDMFKAIPKADVIFMKWILHDWADEDCIKILKNCRKSIPEKSGKVIIVDVVLNSEGDNLFNDTQMVFDLAMMVHCTGGKERDETEWKRLIDEAGFSRINIIKIAALQSIIEAYP